MRGIAFVALGVVGGCFTDAPGDGALKCNFAGGRLCPSGFECADDRRCYRTGRPPDLAGADLELAGDAAVEDLSLADLAGADLSVGDLSGCEGLSCQISQCDAGVHTSLSGQVKDPSGTAPIYNALVFVPGAALTPFVDGPSCAPCSELVSGAPIVSTRTAVDGSFRLDDVPAGDNIPLVVQVGKWRRQTILTTVNACVDNAVPLEQTRLPKNKTEGDIPLHAITTGSADSIECVLRILGVEDSEFTSPTGPGRIHLYVNNGAIPSPTPSPVPASELTASSSTLRKYDVVMFGCTGTPAAPSPSPTANVADYVASGGKLVITHHNYTWITLNPSLVGIASWSLTSSPPNPPDPLTATIPQTTPKTSALAQWLIRAGSTEGLGTMTVRQSRALATDAPASTVDWVRASATTPSVQLLSAAAPLGVPVDQQCGRVAFVGYHTPTLGTSTFPTECEQPTLIQHRALEFVFYDLFACP